MTETKLLFGDKDAVHPQPLIQSLCYIKNVVKNPNIIIGDYTYYDDADSCGEDFEKHVTHFYPHIGDRLVIGRFCSIAKGVEFIMNGANHPMNGVSAFPFGIFIDQKPTIPKDIVPYKGDTVIGNDVWIGQNVTFLPGVHVGDGCIIGASSVVARDIPPYCIAAGNPARVVKKRFDDATIARLEEIAWWNLEVEEIEAIYPMLQNGDVDAFIQRYSVQNK